MRIRAAAVAAFCLRGVPSLSAEAGGVFRILFVTLVLAYAATRPVRELDVSAVDLLGRDWGHAAVLRALAGHPALLTAIDPLLIAFGAAAIAGLLTRASYAAFAVLLVVWGAANTATIGHHPFSALLVAALMLVPARWADAWSVDALVRTARGRPPRRAPPTWYGFAPWALTLTLGVVFAAAAWSKVREGPAWILNGTVRYHFVSDLRDALVPWGPWLASLPGMAVLLSAAAVAVEAAVLTAAFSRSMAVRAVMGALALSLLAGFALFQGVFWPGFWILLIGFLPWPLVTPRRELIVDATPQRRTRLAPLQIAAAILLVCEQAYASFARIEAKPLLSAYDMYSTTYASARDYEEASNLVYQVFTVNDGRRQDVDGCVVDDRTARAFAAAIRGDEGERRQIARALERCLDGRPATAMIGMAGDRRVFDWNTGEFFWKRGLDVVGPAPVDWLRP